MFELDITDWDVYYLNNYIKNNDIKIANLNDRKLSAKIIYYKDEKMHEILLFTQKLIKFISFSLNFIIGDTFDKLALVSILPFEVDKLLSFLESINLIERRQSTKKTTCELICRHEILNDNILIRYTNVNSVCDECPRITCGDNLNSILFNNDFIFEKNRAFILIEDITTICTIMDVFENILIKNNIEKISIYKLAISKKGA